MNRQTFYNKTGSTYTDDRYGSPHMRLYLTMRNEALERVMSDWARNGESRTILDVGCGTGLTLSHTAQVSQAHQVFGVDFSITMARQAYSRMRSIGAPRLALADAKQLPFTNDAFDMVYTTRFIHQFKDKRSLFAEFARVTKPGGVLAIEFYRRPYHAIRYWATRQTEPWVDFMSHFPNQREVHRIVGGEYSEVPLRLAGARLIYAIAGEKGVRWFTRASFVPPLSWFVDEYFVVIRK